MNHLTIYRHPELGELRTLSIDGEPWFVGKDVAEVLGYAKPQNAIANHVDSEDKALAPIQGGCSTGTQSTLIINESGLYSLILSSKLPSAKEFKRWVTSTILPAIRSAGGYIAGEERMDDDQLMAQALIVASRKLEQRTAQLRAANAAIEEMAPKAAYYDAVAASDGDKSFRETAKMFGVPEKKFIRILIEKRYIYRDAHGTLVPYADHMKRGQFTVREVVINGVETLRSASQTKITPVGRQAIWRMLAKEGEVSL